MKASLEIQEAVIEALVCTVYMRVNETYRKVE